MRGDDNKPFERSTPRRSWVIADGLLALADGTSISVPSADEIYRSVLEGAQCWPDVEPGPTGEARDLRFSPYPAVPRLVLQSSNQQPFVSFEARLATGGSIHITADALRHGHTISDGVWYPLDEETAASVAALAGRMGIHREGSLGSLRVVLELKQEKASGSGLVEDVLPLDSALAMRLIPAGHGVPRGIRATLYPYQLDGWRWIRFVIAEGIGGLLADEMGLGKTLQVISAISDSAGDLRSPVLIVAPGSLLENWCRELARFAPDLSVLKHHGSQRTGSPAALDGHNVVVTSYETVLRDGALMNMREWTLVVLDEAQSIRNPSAHRTQAVKRLRRRAGLAVTGTPMENRLLDVWSIVDFVRPGYLCSEEEFIARYGDSVEQAQQLEPVISPLILRRRVVEVARDLPERIDVPQVLELDEATAHQYDDLRSSVLAEYDKAASLVALTKLRMFCAHPALVDELTTATDFIKLQRLDELVEEMFAAGEKVLIFTSYTKMADRISSRFAAGYSVFARTLDGRLPIPERQALIDSFTAVRGGAALVLNPRAGGAGLNIVAANHVVHYNPEWNPAMEDQASARAHRRGQTRPVTVHRLLIAGTVEEVIDERLRRKRQVSAAAIVGVEGEADDLRDIVAALDRSPLRKRR